jgi:hypothetical protein
MINNIQELKKRVRAWGGGGNFSMFFLLFSLLQQTCIFVDMQLCISLNKTWAMTKEVGKEASSTQTEVDERKWHQTH